MHGFYSHDLETELTVESMTIDTLELSGLKSPYQAQTPQWFPGLRVQAEFPRMP